MVMLAFNPVFHPYFTGSVLPPKKLKKWCICSNGSTSIPETLKEFPRLLEKLDMVRNNFDFMVSFTEI